MEYSVKAFKRYHFLFIGIACLLLVVPLLVIADDSAREVQALQTEVLELKAWKEAIQARPIAEEPANNRFYFRGGYMQTGSRTGREGDLLTDLNGIIGQSNGDQGFYFGASLDMSLTDDLWGASEEVELLAELMFEYHDISNLIAGSQFEEGDGINPLNAIVKGALGPDAGNDNLGVQTTMFVLGLSPKFKFMPGYDFRPWIIPAGFAMHIISPPSDGFTLLTPAVMFGAGFDYNVWKNVSLGMDGRYQLASKTGVDGVNTDSWTIGFTLGFGF